LAFHDVALLVTDWLQYLDLLKRFTPATLSQEHLSFLQDLERVGSDHSSQIDALEQLSRNENPEKKEVATLVRKAQCAVARLPKASEEKNEDNGVTIWSGPSADKPKPSPLRTETKLDMSHLEKDFTIAGTPSRLGCPFASRSGQGSPLATPRSSTSRMSFQGRRSKRPSFTDPIRAEICGNDPASPVASASGSVEGSAAVCPIRFLDQHKPEEVAKYFENHKHEIPRSHEVCIKRFQSNAESIEALDRKYGNLVSMVQGLGQRHQEFLPPEPEEDEDESETDAKKEEKVQKWANAVTASLQGLTPEEGDSPDNIVDEARTAHFDRPMKEVRLGESPSRPWGIQVPAKYTNAESSSSVGSAPTASPPLPLETIEPVETPQKASKCPFDHRAFGKAPEVEDMPIPHKPEPRQQPPPPPPPLPPRAASPTPLPRAQQRQQQKQEHSSTPNMIPQMVFNGPVFLGYPPEQLLSILQKSNLGGMMQ
jgi:hypothetical protein